MAGFEPDDSRTEVTSDSFCGMAERDEMLYQSCVITVELSGRVYVKDVGEESGQMGG